MTVVNATIRSQSSSIIEGTLGNSDYPASGTFGSPSYWSMTATSPEPRYTNGDVYCTATLTLQVDGTRAVFSHVRDCVDSYPWFAPGPCHALVVGYLE
jgi:hypothetical protein